MVSEPVETCSRLANGLVCCMLQVAAILPELEGRFMQLLKNRLSWNERFLSEIEKDAKRSPDDIVADQASPPSLPMHNTNKSIAAVLSAWQGLTWLAGKISRQPCQSADKHSHIQSHDSVQLRAAGICHPIADVHLHHINAAI